MPCLQGVICYKYESDSYSIEYFINMDFFGNALPWFLMPENVANIIDT